MSKWAYKAELHKAKKNIGFHQGAIAKRRIELFAKLEPLIANESDRKLLKLLLMPKNLTPRYW